MVAARSVTVKLGLDASDFYNGLAEAAVAANAFQKALGGSGGSIDNAGKALDGTADSAKHLNEEIGASNASAEELSATMSELTDEVNASKIAMLDQAKANGVLDRLQSNHEKTLRNLAAAQENYNKALRGGSKSDQATTLLALNEAQERVTNSTLALAAARGEKLTTATLAMERAEIKLAKAQNDHERNLLSLGKAEAAYEKALESGSVEREHAALVQLNAAQIRAAQSSLNMAESQEKLNHEVDALGVSMGNNGGRVDAFGKSLGDADDNNNRFGKGIAASNSHMALLVQYAVALGPALVPALAAAVPLAAALGSGLAVASVGAGVAVLAFQGVGDALKAMNDYAIDPTEAHLKALNEAMDTLGPAGQNFVVFLQELRPEIQQLQNIAQEGLFPGLQDGIESVLTQMPLIQQVISTVSTAMGDLAREGGEALTNPFWTEFFTYIRDDATDIITNFSVGFGKLFEGVSALLLDFGPLTQDIAVGFANMGRSFSTWAQGLDETAGFQEFIRYLRETGPQVLDTIGNLAQALLDIGVALSGLPAQASLAILNTLADVLSQIANSAVGPGLLAAAVGISAMTRAIGLWDTVQASAMMQFFGKGIGGKGGGLASIASAATFANLTKVAGGISLLALSMTGLGDAAKDAGISGTLTGASIGAFFGPWGAAAGAAAGAISDAAAANNDFETSVDAVNQALEATPTNLANINTALETSRAEMNKQLDRLEGGSSFLDGVKEVFDPAWHKNHIEGLFGKSDADEIKDNFATAEEAVDSFNVAATALKNQFDDNFLTKSFDTKELQDFLTDVQPALDHFGVTMQDLTSLSVAKAGDNPILAGAAQIEWDTITAKLEHYSETIQTVPGQEKAVGEALANLGAEAGNTQADIDALAGALDALFSPALNYSQAMDDWRQGLADLAKDLKGSSLDPNTTVGRGNRDVVRERVQGLIDVLNAAAANGAGPAQLTKRLMTMRDQLVEVGKQAGLRGADLRDFLATLNLTPKDIRIIVRQFGVAAAKKEAQDLAADIKKIPKDVKTDIAANGLPADATVKSLMAKYDGLSKKDATTILKAQDAASPLIAQVLKHLKGLEHDFTARVNVDTGSAAGQITGILVGLHAIDNTNATATVTVHNNTVNTVLDRHLTAGDASGSIHEYASGGTWPWPAIGAQQPQIQGNKGPGGIKWAETGAGPWEAFISGNPNKRERSRDIATDVVNRLGGVAQFADGGQVGRHIDAGDIGRRATRSDVSFIKDLERALRRMRHEAKEAEHAEDRFRRAREHAREVTHRLADIEKRLEEAQSKEHVNAKEVYRLKQLEITQRHREKEAIKAQTQAEKEATKERDEATKAAEKWKEMQRKLTEEARAIADTVLEQGAIFGGQGTSTTVGGILAKLRQSNEDAAKFRHYIQKLRGMGLDERIIQQLLEQGPTPEGLATARNLAQASERQIGRINRQERQLVGVASATGATGVSHHTTNVNVKIEKVETTDMHRLDRELTRYTRNAVRIARAKA